MKKYDFEQQKKPRVINTSCIQQQIGLLLGNAGSKQRRF